MSTVCRYAPTTSGPAHLGTLAAGLLAWLDARSRNARFLLRLEDIDRDRCKPEYARSIIDDLTWLGLDWESVVEQHSLRPQHEAAMDRLERLGVLYPAPISREELRALGRRTPDGGFAYDNRHRNHTLPSGGWRACRDPIRARLPDRLFTPLDEGGTDLSGNPAASFGDPVVRRRDGQFTYHLAVVVDDAAASVNRIIRGRDIAPSTATHAALQSVLDYPSPIHRHHLLLLEDQGGKLAKSHGAARARAEGPSPTDARPFCGALAFGLGLLDQPAPISPAELLPLFDWSRVPTHDCVAHWTDGLPRLTPIAARAGS